MLAMKSEKRHELQKNELADWIGNHAEGASEYFWPIVGGVVAAFALAVGIAWYMNTREATAAVAWHKYYQAHAELERDAELKQVADDYASSAAAHWAKLGFADLNLARGANLLFKEKSEGNSKLLEAEKAYQDVLDKARDPELITRAQFGMARTKESRCQPEDARKYYEMVAKAEKDSPLGKAAARSAARMADPKTVEFLAWFAKAQPRKPTPVGHGGMPGMPPFNVPTDLPERPDLSLPGPLNIDPGKLPGDAPNLDFPKPGETPAPEAPKPGPAPEAPKTEAPKAEPPPAAPKNPGE
jgi:hypothetical protein